MQDGEVIRLLYGLRRIDNLNYQLDRNQLPKLPYIVVGKLIIALSNTNCQIVNSNSNYKKGYNPVKRIVAFNNYLVFITITLQGNQQASQIP